MTLDAEEKGERGRLSQSTGITCDSRQVGGVGETGPGESGGDPCSKLEGLAGDIAEEFECLLATGVGDLERLARGVVDLDVLLLAGDKSVSSDSDARLILACRAFARVIFSKTHFSSSNWCFLLLSSIISSVICSHTL